MSEYAIIPRPVSVRYGEGNFYFAGLPVIAGGEFPAFDGEAAVFNTQIEKIGGEDFRPVSGCIKLVKTETENVEAYRLEINSDTITVSAAAGVGVFRGLQVLRQLVLSGYGKNGLSIRCGVIEDRPRFSWRGFMLDCSRHFFTVDFIKNLLDALSLHHINIFHWHLTDDQGWRLPVEKYPLLTEIGSRRRDHRLSGQVYGGVYTHDDIRGVVAYAAERHIEVVPEVDLPGHTSSVLAAYPGLGCTSGPYRVEDRYGVFEEALCAGNDGIFPLAEAVFDTLAELFPSRYVHIGGDEVLFNRWSECSKCRGRMKELGLEDPAELQSWITFRLTEMLRRRGKTAIGWDEILENTGRFPLPEDTVIMSWRGEEGGNKAVAAGRRVIMTPVTAGCYLDYRHTGSVEEIGRDPVSTVAQAFNMEPVTAEMERLGKVAANGAAKGAASLVLGGQGNLWSEVVYAGKLVEYMIFPRICALAESFWSNRRENGEDIKSFASRLEVHRRRLDRLGLLQYRGHLE